MMKPFIVLLGSFLITVILLKLIKNHIDYKLAARIAMSIMLVFTAIGHFIYGNGMKSMIPEFIPYRHEIIMVTGVLEIFFAVGLLFPKYKLAIGCLLIAFLILALPTNIYAAIKQLDYQTGNYNGKGISYLWFRIPLQIVFVLWVYFSTIINSQ